MFKWFVGAFLGLAVLQSAAAMIAEKDPVVQAKKVAEQLIGRLDAERTQLEASNDRINALANELVFPYVDITKMARFAMGANWRSATPEQQQTFTDLFKRILLNSYAKSFLKLQIDRIDFGASRAGASGKDVEIPATVFEKTGTSVPVIFRLLPSGDSWKIYDLEVQGISLLLNYRSVYATEIDQKGLPAVLEQMKVQANAI
ncbi:MAG: ABC transporter substrate-binding protein [Thiotrichales bacterium]|jgi:phospholipid transport system substrate-binding protein|nr:ABC transporter substrate-binding protein [Thiotrichales bacterium]